jgi:hypothetical protein
VGDVALEPELPEGARALADAIQAADHRVLPHTTPAGNPSPWPLERSVVQRVRDALVEGGLDDESVITEKVKIRSGFDPMPGAIDLVAGRPGAGADHYWFAVEFKLDNVGEMLQDAIKLVHALEFCDEAYMVVAAHSPQWKQAGSELFPGSPGEQVVIPVQLLLAENHEFHRKKNLENPDNRCRIQVAPRHLRLTRMPTIDRLHHYPHLEVRVARVDVADPERVQFQAGWPEGVDPDTGAIAQDLAEMLRTEASDLG